MGKMDSMKGVPSTTGAKAPKGAAKADMSGERSEKLKGGVGMGKEDKTAGMEGEFNTGRTSGICYEHKKDGYR